MTNRMTKTAAMIGALGAVSLAATARAETPAPNAQPTTEELVRQIEALQERVEAMQADQAATSDQVDQAALDRAIDSVLADTQQRSELLSMQGFTAGYSPETGFALQSADGAFVLRPFVQFQFRNVTTFGFDDEDADDVDQDLDLDVDVDFDDVANGFEIRRAKFGFRGNVFTEALEYKFQWAAGRTDGTVDLEDAYIVYEFSDNWAFRAGQWKDNVFFEESTSSSRQMAVDRSGVNELLGGGITDRVQGASLIYDSDTVRAEFAYHDGANSDNTSAFDTVPDFGVSGRAEFKVFGSWGDYADFSTLVRTPEEDLLVVGVGANYTEDGDSAFVPHTVDALYKSSTTPISVFGAYYGTYADGELDDGYNGGAELQIAYGVNDRLELFARGGVIILDLDSLDDINQQDDLDDDSYELTIGGNYYFEGHAAKVTIDATYLPNGYPDSNSGIGYAGNEEDQLIIRGQFQLLL